MTLHCSLNLWGLATEQNLKDAFWASMHDFSYTSKSFIAALKQGDPLDFQQMLPREIDSIEVALMRVNLGFRINWKSVNAPDAGTILWDPLEQKRYSFAIVDRALQVPIETLDCPDKIAQARAGHALYSRASKMPLAIANSSHDVIGLTADRPELAPFAAIFAAA